LFYVYVNLLVYTTCWYLCIFSCPDCALCDAITVTSQFKECHRSSNS